jgi:hypothetical protein
MFMKNLLRILGSVLIAGGVGIFITSALAGIAYHIYMLFVVQEYISGIVISGAMLIALGIILRLISKETLKK